MSAAPEPPVPAPGDGPGRADLPAALDQLLDEAEGVVAPSISALIWQGGEVRYTRRPERVYDLASLTKPLCTAELALGRVASGCLVLNEGHELLPPGVTLAHLLQHGAGWPAWRPFYELVPEGTPARRAEILRAVLDTPLANPPGAVHTYSDLGFIALGAVVEALGGGRLDTLWKGPLTWGDPRSEPTDGARGGPVNDLNARAMDGVAPHAGLYGTAEGVLEVARRWLDADVLPAGLVALAWKLRGPGTHVLGWDTPSPGGQSTAGASAPPDTVGHLGYTGTTVWLSPSRRLVSVLLTNRVAATLDPLPIRGLRRAFHELAWAYASRAR